MLSVYRDRKSTRLNSSHLVISYAVFCLKKKKLTTAKSRFMIIPILCVTILPILVVWFLLPRVARRMIHTTTAISISVCLSIVQLMAVCIAMRRTLVGHFLQVALTLIMVVGYAIAAS